MPIDSPNSTTLGFASGPFGVKRFYKNSREKGNEMGDIDLENPYYSTTRNWILNRLDEQIPNSGTIIDSIHNKQKFTLLTGVDQAYLQSQWDGGSRFTTCTGFLSVLWSGASAAGGSARKLRPFEMFKH